MESGFEEVVVTILLLSRLEFELDIPLRPDVGLELEREVVGVAGTVARLGVFLRVGILLA